MKKTILVEKDDPDYDPHQPSFEELYGVCREQMEFESRDEWLQEMLGRVPPDVAEALIGLYDTQVSNGTRAAAREIERDRLQARRDEQLSGFTDHNAKVSNDTDALARKVQAYRKDELAKGVMKKNIKSDAMREFEVSKGTYHNLLNRKLP